MRAHGMQVLTDNVLAVRSKTVIYGIGDKDHQQSTSGHNEDDTSGVKAEDQDADSTPEHRALDFMLGPDFSADHGWALVKDLTSHGANQSRLIYVNYFYQQWHRKNNWVPVPNNDDPHTDHVHASGEADADENVSPWILPALEAMELDANDKDTALADTYRLDAALGMKDEAVYTPQFNGGKPVHEPNRLKEALVKLQATVEKPDVVEISDADIDRIVEKLGPKIEDVVRSIFLDGGTK
jgi:hypothetical protein